jgi:hypothetical protein
MNGPSYFPPSTVISSVKPFKLAAENDGVGIIIQRTNP